MAIQKKSLISNRTATKKALVAKPEVASKTGVTRMTKGIETRIGMRNKVAFRAAAKYRLGLRNQ
jgi:hypothetical protein